MGRPPSVRRGGFDAAASPLVDREHELGEMRDALVAALTGSGRVLLLGGEAGIGKSRLASVLADDAEARGLAVWWGRGWEDGSAPAYWPWNTALRGWMDRGGAAAIAAAAGPWIDELANVFPVLREHSRAGVPHQGLESDRARFRLFDTVGRFLAAVAAPAGLLVVLDDVHWADHPSLKLLEYVAADLREARLLIIATYRDIEVQHDDVRAGILSRIAREASARRMLLGGLSAAHCAQWVAQLPVVRGDAAALGEALHRETNGNPFFLGEMVQLLTSQSDPAAEWQVREVPSGVVEVIARRLDRLGAKTHGTLAVAALLGDPFDGQLLGEILESPPVADLLQEAMQHRLVIEVSGRTGQFAFAHGLIRRVLTDALQPSVRAAWHLRIAMVLERHQPTTGMAVTELVHHFAAADTPDALRRAFDHACGGAEQAARGLGWEEAVRLYRIALDVGTRSGVLDGARALELRLALAHALRGAGDVTAARAQCDELLAACRRAPNPSLMARAALVHAGPLPEFGRLDLTARAALEEAAAQPAAAIDDGLRARLYARLAGDLIGANEVEQGGRVVSLCDDAARAARRAGDHGALAMALIGIFYAAALRMRRPADAGGRATPVPDLQEILDAAEAGGQHDFAAAVRHLRGAMLFGLGEAEAFSAEIDGLATLAAVSRAPEAQWLADALAALRATVEGRFADARELMDRARGVGMRMQLPNAEGQHTSQIITLHLIQGRLAEIVAQVDAFVAGQPGGRGWEPVRALAHLAVGEAARAREEFEMLLSRGFGPAESGVMSRCYLGGLAWLCVGLRDRERAAALYDRIARQRQVWIIDGCQTLGPWSLVLGALARLCGKAGDAVGHFEAAIADARRMHSRPFLAHAQILLAGVLLGGEVGEHRDRVAHLVGQAEQVGRGLGLAHVLARAERLHAKLSGRRAAAANAFRCDGEVWTVSFAGRDVLLKDGKGPRYLAALLAAPGRELHVLQLAAPAQTDTAVSAGDLEVGALGGALDDGPDARARREYRSRVEDVRAELEEAERLGDLGRAEHLRAELEGLTVELAQRFGGHARTRGPAETARKAVTKVLRTQIGRLLESHPPLGQHLRDALRMGTVCVYAPSRPTTWDVIFPRSAGNA